MVNMWLMKSEPEDRENLGVKFSVDDFETAKTTSWEGVRNPEANKIMRDMMKIGDKVFFYHSNCKTPGIVALAEVIKEGHPDYNAWDPKHHYYDKLRPNSFHDTPNAIHTHTLLQKTDPQHPKWYMVDLKFTRRLPHFVSLAVLKYIASRTASEYDTLPDYLTPEHIEAVGEMSLFKRSRLSVQPVGEKAWETVMLLADGDGWVPDELNGTKIKGKGKAKAPVKKQEDPVEDVAGGEKEVPPNKRRQSLRGEKRKREAEAEEVKKRQNAGRPYKGPR